MFDLRILRRLLPKDVLMASLIFNWKLELWKRVEDFKTIF